MDVVLDLNHSGTNCLGLTLGWDSDSSGTNYLGLTIHCKPVMALYLDNTSVKQKKKDQHKSTACNGLSRDDIW